MQITQSVAMTERRQDMWSTVAMTKSYDAEHRKVLGLFHTYSKPRIMQETTKEKNNSIITARHEDLPLEPRAAPKEPFDNTKYQNLQHFSYTPFTFVDVDVELAKLRLPQPSSGRPSPRH
ncbi:unnamed protein product [Ranitomeya imitator]|uniref:NADH dehydrogenase [ubiquinone] flavoprotein 3, mitochondrial n=1 Tax=Ranitomeya imitator TaxID=111125 RepID=A0ABN9L7P5_9NEOB|nr:unnamed protein product [Ranitomeya imitator]